LNSNKVNKYLFRIIFVWSLFLFQPVCSQDYIDLLSAGTNYVPDNKYENSDSSFKLAHNFLHIQYPKVFENKDVFLTKLSLNHYRWAETSNLDFYNIYLQLGLLKHFGEKTSLRFAVTPKISSQLKDIEGNDFVVPVIGVLQLKPKETFSWGLGIYYSYEFFGHYFNPAIYIKWDINDHLTFYSDFPSYGYLAYHKDQKLNTGIWIASSTTSVRLSNEYNSRYIQKGYVDASWFYDLYLTKNIVIRAKAGYSVMRALDLYAKNDKVPFTFSVMEFNDERVQLNDDIDDAFFFEISLNYRYHY